MDSRNHVIETLFKRSEAAVHHTHTDQAALLLMVQEGVVAIVASLVEHEDLVRRRKCAKVYYNLSLGGADAQREMSEAGIVGLMLQLSNSIPDTNTHRCCVGCLANLSSSLDAITCNNMLSDGALCLLAMLCNNSGDPYVRRSICGVLFNFSVLPTTREVARLAGLQILERLIEDKIDTDTESSILCHSAHNNFKCK